MQKPSCSVFLSLFQKGKYSDETVANEIVPVNSSISIFSISTFSCVHIQVAATLEQHGWMNLTPFLLLLNETAAMLLLLFAPVATLSQLLHRRLGAIRFVPVLGQVSPPECRGRT